MVLPDSERVYIPPVLAIRMVIAVADEVCGTCHASAVHTYRYPDAPWRLHRCARHTNRHLNGLLRKGHAVIDENGEPVRAVR